jgi:hypothetical protein
MYEDFVDLVSLTRSSNALLMMDVCVEHADRRRSSDNEDTICVIAFSFESLFFYRQYF